MNTATCNTIAEVIGVGLVLALIVFGISIAFMIVRWKTDKRRGHVIRSLLAVAAYVVLVAVEYCFSWFVFMPALGRELMAKVDFDRADRMAKSTLVHIGDRAPEFTLVDVDGEQFTLKDMRGRVVLLNFFATWCGPCLAELPHVEKIWMDHKDNKNFRLLVIGREETTESVQEFRSQKRFLFPMAADPDRAVFSQFATKSIPRIFVISPDGLIVYSKMGFALGDLPELHSVLDSQLQETP